MVHAVIDGRVYKVYKNLWPSIREFWRTSVTENKAIHDLDYLVFEDTRITYGQADHMVQRTASMLREVLSFFPNIMKSVLICFTPRSTTFARVTGSLLPCGIIPNGLSCFGQLLFW